MSRRRPCGFLPSVEERNEQVSERGRSIAQRFAFLMVRGAFALALGGTSFEPDANRGAAAAIMRANPFSAMVAHCQLTVRRSGAGKLAVVHTRLTSLPGAAAVSGVHSHTRPSSSVTLRDDIVGVSM
jgi:hypothetical protein